MKKEVYLNEYNVLMSNAIYLPLASGLLQAYATTIPDIQKNYQFMPFLFIRNHPEKIIAQYKNPGVAAFSVSMWNMNLSIAIAEKVKKTFPECLIVFGGPNVPFNAEKFFLQYPFVDVTVRGEGEQAFADILMRFLQSRDFTDIPGISYRDYKSGACIKNSKERPFVKDLDIFPSPYLERTFDYLLSEDINFQTIIETNRGCPYMCSYCFWGKGGLSKQYGLFSLDRVRKIAEWCGIHRIKYVFCADSNFGIFKRDFEIARYFVEAKLKHGFPEKFRVCYAKNAEDTVFEIGKLLHKHSMEKSITMARQTNYPEAASNVGRKNIKMELFNKLQKKYNDEDIPVYTELILGLPGETYESFLAGIEEILQSGIKNQAFVYFCQVYPNTELADEKYRQKFNISTIRIPLSETHAAVRSREIVPEYEEIIISTASMSVEDWKRMAVVSWIMQLFHGLKLGFYIMLYLADRYHVKYTELFEYIALSKIKSNRAVLLNKEVANFYAALDSILQGKSRMRYLHEFGDIYWDQEEASYLHIVCNKEEFYDDMYEVIKEYLDNADIKYDEEELKEVIDYQNLVIPHFNSEERLEYFFKHNIPEYFETYFSEKRSGLTNKPQVMTSTDIRDYKEDKMVFAREVLLYGRKSNRMLRTVLWSNIDINNELLLST